MNVEKRVKLNEEELNKVMGGLVWKPRCDNCGTEMLGGKGVHKVGAYKNSSHMTGFAIYYCDKCFKNKPEGKIEPKNPAISDWIQDS